MNGAGIQIAITGGELISALLGLLGVILSAFWLMAWLLVQQVEKRWDERILSVTERLNGLKALLSERHEYLAGETDSHEQALTDLRRQCDDCRQNVMVRFVTTQEFYETLGPLQNRLDRIIDEYVGNRRSA